MFSFDEDNRTLMFHTQFFAAQPEVVLMVKWAASIKRGARIKAGTRLGVVIFNDGSEVAMKTPIGVAGDVLATNRRIEYETLGESPAQFAVRLA